MVKTLADKFRDSAEETESMVCWGYDPASAELMGYQENLPSPLSDFDPEEVKKIITEYFTEAKEKAEEKNVKPGAFKPNKAYFEAFNQPSKNQYQGSEALTEVISEMRDLADVPIILDAKIGDIGRSSAHFAAANLKRDVDAVTVHPYMGKDSIMPIAEIAEEGNNATKEGQGIFILARTTNPGAKDFQDKTVASEDHPFYMEVANKIVEWSEEHPGTIGAVVAGNHLDEVEDILRTFKGRGIATLIPGVGAQGGKTQEVIEVMKKVGYDPKLAGINSSSGIMYAVQKKEGPYEEHAEATVEEVERMNNVIRTSVSL